MKYTGAPPSLYLPHAALLVGLGRTNSYIPDIQGDHVNMAEERDQDNQDNGQEDPKVGRAVVRGGCCYITPPPMNRIFL